MRLAFLCSIVLLQACSGTARHLEEMADAHGRGTEASHVLHRPVHRPRVRSLLENATDLGPQLSWVEQFGGSGREMGMAVASDGAGSVYSAGFFSSQNTRFGSLQLASRSPTGSDAYLTKARTRGSAPGLNWSSAELCLRAFA